MTKNIPWPLIIAKLKQCITPEDENYLDSWRATDGNAAIFQELERLWQHIQANAGGYAPDADYYWKALSARMKAGGKEKNGVMRKMDLLSWRRYAAVASLFLFLSFSLAFYLGVRTGRPEAATQVCTNLSGKSKVHLSDGTDVWLHTRTSLAYTTGHSSGNRQVKITGEAYFDVAPDARRPFIVQTEGMEVVVHGTKFNVETFPDSKNTLVSLVEGSVELITGKEQRFLVPGQTAIFDKRKQELKVENSDVGFMASWAKDRLVFTESSLGDVCRSLSRWYRVEIRVAPQLSDKFLYTFTLRDEPLEEILRLMARINPVSYSFSEENTVILSPK